MIGNLLQLGNGEATTLDCMPCLSWDDFTECVLQATESGGSVASLFAQPADDGRFQLIVVLQLASRGNLGVCSTIVGATYPSLTVDCPQVHWFERELAEQWGIVPQGHPWLKPIRFAPPLGGPAAGLQRPPIGDMDFFRMEGDEVHEVAVGPVHAGVIEPGHFRFQCHGETVHHLEISLGYQHRGVERSLMGGPDKRTIHIMETLAGDTTIGHAWAYCQAIEALASCHAPARSAAIRGIALELERLANHIGDLGALAGDVAFLPTASFCGRIRGDVLNLTALLCGNRFGRGLVRPGGTAFDLDDKLIAELQHRLTGIAKDTKQAVNMLWDTPTVMARFEETGALSAETAREIGLVGPAARACGIDRDVRNDLPFGIYCFAHIPPNTWHTGDVFARAYVRWLEVEKSLAFVNDQLLALPPGQISAPAGALAPSSIAVSLTEGWRGEICHVALTGPQGTLSRYKVVDPSFHNWFGLALTLRGQQVSDFPLCNKSFNLSYCGHDL